MGQLGNHVMLGLLLLLLQHGQRQSAYARIRCDRLAVAQGNAHVGAVVVIVVLDVVRF